MSEMKLNNLLQDSVTLKKGAKGYQWEIKLYFNGSSDEDIKNTENKLNKINEELKNKFGDE